MSIIIPKWSPQVSLDKCYREKNNGKFSLVLVWFLQLFFSIFAFIVKIAFMLLNLRSMEYLIPHVRKYGLEAMY